MKRQQKKTIFSIALSSCILLYFVFFYLWDNYLGVIPVPTNQKIDIRGQLMVRAKWAERMVKGSPVRIVRTISVCKKFPDSYKDQFFTIIGPNDQCEKVQETAEERRWIDPWGRPYQIRYDLERAKLQVRSQGRYLWWPWDDISDETYFDGKNYKAQVEYCKTVPKDDMSCIFNRGWH